MSTSSSKKLTKFNTGKTVVTADFANTIYGGLKDSPEGALLDPEDPRVGGHVHDGEPYDGHSSKISLVNHVAGKLLHKNLANESVWKSNILSSVNQDQAIPESYIDGSTKYYFLDLREVYTYIDDEIASVLSSTSAFEQADSNGDYTVDVVRQSDYNYGPNGYDFVFGSASLDDMSDSTKGDHRFLFNRTKGAFRAGIVDGAQWNTPYLGDYSFGCGKDNIASGDGSFVGGESNTVDGKNSTAFGQSNSISGVGNFAVGVQNQNLAGNNNSISGRENIVYSSNSVIGGRENITTGDFGLVVGYMNEVDGDGCLVVGKKNFSKGNYNNVFGFNNSANNDGGSTSECESSIICGVLHQGNSKFSAIFGYENTLGLGANGSAIFGTSNSSEAPNSLTFGKECKATVAGEFVHGAGKHSVQGDSQVSQYVLKGLIPAPVSSPGNILSVDGSSYKLGLNDAYNISVMLVGKLEGPTQEAGAYKIEALVIGQTTTPASATIVSSSITTIGATSYFSAGPGYVGVTMSISPTNNYLDISVFDSHPLAGFIRSRWVATVTVTKCKY